MNILITGAAGFVGRHLLSRLLEEGHHCRCLIRDTARTDGLFTHPRVEIFQGDITQPATLMSIGEGINVVYHLAASGHVSAVSQKSSQSSCDLNVRGTRNIAEACGREGVKRFIHFSSTAAMGLIRLPKINESIPCRPLTPYQKSKFEGEAAALETGRKFRMDTVVLRPCMIYGPGGKGEFLKFCRLIKKGLFPRIGRGENRTPIVHVNDVVQAAVASLYKGRPGEIYLVASETSPPLAEIHECVTAALNVRRPYFYIPFPAAYAAAFVLEKMSLMGGTHPVVSRKNIISTVSGRVFDISKAREELSYHPRTELREGIRDTVSWFRRENLLM